MKNLKIYFTSDLHGYIYPTNYVDRSEKNIGLLNIINQYHKDENTLIIDAGDTIQGSPFTNYLNNKDFDRLVKSFDTFLGNTILSPNSTDHLKILSKLLKPINFVTK